ncbi:MAG: hypothetical protein GY856_45325 [bacterium]|nr:hypothetical protein [bacterium]
MVRAGRVDEFEPGSVSLIQAGRFFLTRLDDGGFLAQWQVATTSNTERVGRTWLLGHRRGMGARAPQRCGGGPQAVRIT